ncbi:MAG: hypothetical protein HY665_04080 [Chloroflexi bacterium]|nr:hypothetical protein [Chloroflexota bacterium]
MSNSTTPHSPPVKTGQAADFDASDLEYLVTHFTASELRHEARRAEVDAAACHALNQDDLAGFFELLQSYLEWARDLLVRAIPKPKPRPGRVDLASIKASADIVAVIGQYTKLRKAGNRYTGLCPLHSDKRTASLVVYPDQGSWYCFGACNRGGDVLDFIMAAEHTDFRGAVARLEANI